MPSAKKGQQLSKGQLGKKIRVLCWSIFLLVYAPCTKASSNTTFIPIFAGRGQHHLPGMRQEENAGGDGTGVVGETTRKCEEKLKYIEKVV